MLSGIASFMKDTRIADRKQSILEDCIQFDALKCCLGSLVTAFWSKAYELAVLYVRFNQPASFGSECKYAMMSNN